MSAAAAHKNVYCKISYLATEDCFVDAKNVGKEKAWRLSTVKPFTDHVISEFGTSRVMYASNWPVCREHYAEYEDTVDYFKQVVAGHSERDQEMMAAENGRRFYGIN